MSVVRIFSLPAVALVAGYATFGGIGAASASTQDNSIYFQKDGVAISIVGGKYRATATDEKSSKLSIGAIQNIARDAIATYNTKPSNQSIESPTTITVVKAKASASKKKQFNHFAGETDRADETTQVTKKKLIAFVGEEARANEITIVGGRFANTKIFYGEEARANEIIVLAAKTTNQRIAQTFQGEEARANEEAKKRPVAFAGEEARANEAIVLAAKIVNKKIAQPFYGEEARANEAMTSRIGTTLLAKDAIRVLPKAKKQPVIFVGETDRTTELPRVVTTKVEPPKPANQRIVQPFQGEEARANEEAKKKPVAFAGEEARAVESRRKNEPIIFSRTGGLPSKLWNLFNYNPDDRVDTPVPGVGMVPLPRPVPPMPHVLSGGEKFILNSIVFVERVIQMSDRKKAGVSSSVSGLVLAGATALMAFPRKHKRSRKNRISIFKEKSSKLYRFFRRLPKNTINFLSAAVRLLATGTTHSAEDAATLKKMKKEQLKKSRYTKKPSILRRLRRTIKKRWGSQEPVRYGAIATLAILFPETIANSHTARTFQGKKNHQAVEALRKELGELNTQDDRYNLTYDQIRGTLNIYRNQKRFLVIDGVSGIPTAHILDTDPMATTVAVGFLNEIAPQQKVTDLVFKPAVEGSEQAQLVEANLRDSAENIVAIAQATSRTINLAVNGDFITVDAAEAPTTAEPSVEPATAINLASYKDLETTAVITQTHQESTPAGEEIDKTKQAAAEKVQSDEANAFLDGLEDMGFEVSPDKGKLYIAAPKGTPLITQENTSIAIHGESDLHMEIAKNAAWFQWGTPGTPCEITITLRNQSDAFANRIEEKFKGRFNLHIVRVTDSDASPDADKPTVASIEAGVGPRREPFIGPVRRVQDLTAA